jgi:hypothetical protein
LSTALPLVAGHTLPSGEKKIARPQRLPEYNVWYPENQTYFNVDGHGIIPLMHLLLPLLIVLGTPQSAPTVSKVAILPLALQAGTDTAMKTARETLNTLFEKSKHELISPAAVRTSWEDDLKYTKLPEVVEQGEAYPQLPEPRALLEMGRKLGADWVCAGRGKWHTKSVWVGLGPKTKAEFTVDLIIVDVKKSEVALDAKGVKSDSTRKEKGLETAGALLVSMGVTALSGGPKTPHQQRAATQAIALAMEPWLRTVSTSSKKIGD